MKLGSCSCKRKLGSLTKEGIKSNFYLFDPNPNAEKYISELQHDNQIKYFNLAIDNTNSRKTYIKPIQNLYSVITAGALQRDGAISGFLIRLLGFVLFLKIFRNQIKL